jgi:hypothetical protein
VDVPTISTPLVISTCSMIVATCSLILAYFNIRRTNYPIVRLKSAISSYHSSRTRGTFSEFKVLIQNLGVPLNDVSMTLDFVVDGQARASFPLKSSKGEDLRKGQLLKSAIAEYVIATDKFHDKDELILANLRDLKESDPQLSLFSDDYMVWSYPLNDRFAWAKNRWNRFAVWIKFKTMRTKTTSTGVTVYYHSVNLPEFSMPGQQLIGFVNWIRKSKGKDNAELGMRIT